MILTAPSTKETWTDEEFMALTSDENSYEVVDGELKSMSGAGALHGYTGAILIYALIAVVNSQKLGVVLDSSTSFKMKNGNRRSPDVSFFAKERLQGIKEMPIGFLEGAPDLAVEILSPSNTIAEIDGKLLDYFDNGSRLVWVINPSQRYVLVYHCAQEPDGLLKIPNSLEGEAIIPGFSLPLINLFQPLDY